MSKILIVVLIVIFLFVLSHTAIGEEGKSLSLEKKDYRMEKKDYQVQLVMVLVLVTLAIVFG